jgi:hypothetical protein
MRLYYGIVYDEHRLYPNETRQTQAYGGTLLMSERRMLKILQGQVEEIFKAMMAIEMRLAELEAKKKKPAKKEKK